MFVWYTEKYIESAAVIIRTKMVKKNKLRDPYSCSQFNKDKQRSLKHLSQLRKDLIALP